MLPRPARVDHVKDVYLPQDTSTDHTRGLFRCPGPVGRDRADAGGALCGHTAAVRLTDFWSRMRQQFGEAYVDAFSRSYVFSDLGGRTVHEALSAGVDVRQVWQAVCASFDVPPKLR